MGKQTVTAIATLLVLVGIFAVYEHTVGQLTDFKAIDKTLLKPQDDSADDKTPLTKPEYEIAAERALGKEQAARLLEQAVFQYPDNASAESPPGRGLGLFMFCDKREFQYQNDPKLVEFTP